MAFDGDADGRIFRQPSGLTLQRRLVVVVDSVFVIGEMNRVADIDAKILGAARNDLDVTGGVTARPAGGGAGAGGGFGFVQPARTDGRAMAASFRPAEIFSW